MGEVARHVIILGNNTMAKMTIRVLPPSRYTVMMDPVPIPTYCACPSWRPFLATTLVLHQGHHKRKHFILCDPSGTTVLPLVWLHVNLMNFMQLGRFYSQSLLPYLWKCMGSRFQKLYLEGTEINNTENKLNITGISIISSRLDTSLNKNKNQIENEKSAVHDLHTIIIYI